MGSCPPYPLSLGPQLPTAPCVPLASGTPGAQLQVLSHLWSSSPLPPHSTPSLSFSSSLVLLSRSFKVVAGTAVQSNGNTSSSRPVSVIDELGCKQQKSQQKVAQPVRTRPASLTKVQSWSSRVDLETQRCSQGAWLPSSGSVILSMRFRSPLLITKWLLQPQAASSHRIHTEQKEAERGRETFSPETFHQRGESISRSLRQAYLHFCPDWVTCGLRLTSPETGPRQSFECK